MPQTAVILSHGPTVLNGLELSPLPKILLPIGGRTLVEFQGALLTSVGVKQVIVCVRWDDPSISRTIENLLNPFPFQTRCVVQKTDRGTGGTLRELEQYIDGRFWLVGGDLFLFADLAEMLYQHRESGSCATVGALRVEESGWEMERLEPAADTGVKTIHRVHPAHDRRSKLRPAGIYLFERFVLDHIRHHGYFDVKEQLFAELYRQGLPTRAWEICGYSKNLWGLDKYFELQEDVLLKRAGLSNLEQWLPPCTPDDTGQVSPGATLLGPVVLGKDCRVEEGAIIVGPATLGDNCTVARNAVVAECILFAGASVGDSAHVRKCFLGEGTSVPAGERLNDFSILRESPGSSQVSRPLPWSFYGSPTPSFQCVARPRCAENHSKRDYLRSKRVLDIVFSVAALIVTAPVMVLIALAVRLDSRGRAIFRQRRCGRDGAVFTMYKFRSMVESAEERKRELMVLNEVDGPMFKITSDPRTTRVGRFLRATNLDELPQFWNVLRGDMSLVGPRPLSWDEMRYNPSWRDTRILMKPGLIGLWQVESHQKTSFADWVVLDTYYINHCSMWLDVKIILRATWVVLTTCIGGVLRLFSAIGRRHASEGI